MSRNMKAEFASEAELCATFIKQLPAGWTAYPETAGFDILLVRAEDGAQIGIEAKLRLNSTVILQAVERDYYHSATDCGPDFRAVLVPFGTAPHELSSIAKRMWLTVIEMKTKALYLADGRYDRKKFTPALPKPGDRDWVQEWFDLCPWKRCAVPEYVPDVRAGASAPKKLSAWKIKAIKICILLEKTGFLTRKDFSEVGINHRLFLDMGWLSPSSERGKYVAGKRPLDLRRQHPFVYPQVEADFEKWCPKDREASPLLQKQEVLL